MALAVEQVYLLNTIAYLNNPGSNSFSVGETAGDIAQNMLNSSSLINDCSGEFSTKEQIESVCNAIIHDPVVSQMTLEYNKPASANGGDQMIFTMEDASGQRQAIVVFEGTLGGAEWYDNAIAGAPGANGELISPLQKATLDWYNSSEVQGILSTCDSTTVSGHSKGGNKAKLVAIMEDTVDNCISFDGQGFSDEFIEHYAPEISNNQHKIQNYNNADDYVSILLNDVGEKHYIQGCTVKNPFTAHSLFTLYQSLPMNIHEVPQNPLLYEMDMIINEYLRTLNSDDKLQLMDLIGCLLRDTMGGEGELLDIPEYAWRFLATRDGKLFNGFLNYCKKYASAHLWLALLELLKEHFPYISGLLDSEIEKVENEILNLHTNGADMSIAGAERICISTELLADVAATLLSTCAEMQSQAAQISACAAQCNDFPFTVNINLAISALLSKGGLGLFSGSPVHVINQLSKTAHMVSNEIESLSNAVSKAVQIFDISDKKVVDMLY